MLVLGSFLISAGMILSYHGIVCDNNMIEAAIGLVLELVGGGLLSYYESKHNN